MWNPICEWVALLSINKHPTEDSTDRPGNALLVRNDDGGNSPIYEGAEAEVDPEMMDPSKIKQDYAKD